LGSGGVDRHRGALPGPAPVIQLPGLSRGTVRDDEERGFDLRRVLDDVPTGAPDLAEARVPAAEQREEGDRRAPPHGFSFAARRRRSSSAGYTLRNSEAIAGVDSSKLAYQIESGPR